jgi:type IX secretion system PorP/SprF family membrane protein
MSYSQDYTFADPYSEKTFVNPAFAGILECKSFTLNYQKQFVYDFYSASLNLNLNKIKSGASFVISNFSQGKNTFNDLYVSGIYAYHLKISNFSKLSSAIQISYINKSINPENLVFPDMINPETGTISTQTQEITNYPTVNKVDFSAGTSFFSKKIRLGIAIFHIQDIFTKNIEEYNSPKINIHFAKHFFNNSFDNNKKLIRFTPEIIYTYQNNVDKLTIGLLLEKNIFFSKFWLKNNIDFKSFTPVITLGLNNKKLRLSYTYSITLSKYISLPISTNQVSLTYNFNCSKKRNKTNTIYCINF